MVARPIQSNVTVQCGDSEEASRSLTILPQLPGQRKLAHLRRRPVSVISRELLSTESGRGKLAQRVVVKRAGALRRKRSRRCSAL